MLFLVFKILRACGSLKCLNRYEMKIETVPQINTDGQGHLFTFDFVNDTVEFFIYLFVHVYLNDIIELHE